MGIFADHAGAFLDAGLAPFPINTTAKRPAVKGWQKASPGLARAWAGNPRLAGADGLGIVMGPASGLVEVDVDAAGDAWLAAAVDRFGDSPIAIQTASGKYKLWFRHNGEGRHIRPLTGLPIDVLGGGFTIAPPSVRSDGGAYRFIRGGLDDIPRLPIIREGALDFGRQHATERGVDRIPEAVRSGERNDTLWRWTMAQARYCDDVEQLIDAAATWAGAFPDPLSSQEVEKCARSAWAYETSGRNYLGLRRPQLTEKDVAMDVLRDSPDAFYLLSLFERFHRNKAAFFIAPRPLGASLGWRYARIETARDVLLSRGFIEELRPPQRGKAPGSYRLNEMHGSVHNHLTPPSPASPSLERGRPASLSSADGEGHAASAITMPANRRPI